VCPENPPVVSTRPRHVGSPLVRPRNASESTVSPDRLRPDDGRPDTELAAARLRQDLAIEAAGIGSFDWDLVTGQLVWDDRLLDIFGYSRDGFDGSIDAFAARLHPDDAARTLEALQDAIETCGEYEAEFRIVLPSGETRWVQGRGRALADERGTAVRLLGAGYDTTSHRQADARVARVLEAMNAAFFALDRDWRFTYVNAEAERVLGRPREELLGGDIWELYPAAVDSDFEVNYRGAAATGEERVFEAYYPAPLDAWYEVRAWPGPDGLSVYFLDVTERRTAQARAQRSAARLAVIAEVTALTGETLTAGEGEETALQRLAEAVVPVLGDWVIVSLSGQDGRMRDVATWHRDPAERPVVARYADLRLASIQPDAPVLRALSSGRTMTVDDVGTVVGRTLPPGEVSEVFWRLAPRTAVTLPLSARGRTLGALSIYRSADRPMADADDVAAAQEVASRVALALDGARLYEQQRGLAEGLQRSLLTEPPAPDSAEIVVRYRPAVEAAEVGGDWYDAFVQPGGSTVLVIGDVVGHDTAAAAAMGQLRGLLRGIAYRRGIGPAQVLSDLDAAVQGLGMSTMATAAVARVEQTPEQRAAGLTSLRWSNAGHPPPLLLHDDGRVEELATGRPELMLGVDPSARRTESVVTFRRGATVLLYTDGLVEGRDLPLDDGIARLRAALAELGTLPLAEFCDAVIERLRPSGLQDDIALVAIRLHPQD
jgi:PAS domain S-box-containing protein